MEDAPSGLISGRDAGAKTLAVCTSHSREDLEKIKPDYIVADLTRLIYIYVDHCRANLIFANNSVSIRWVEGQLEVTIRGT